MTVQRLLGPVPEAQVLRSRRWRFGVLMFRFVAMSRLVWEPKLGYKGGLDSVQSSSPWGLVCWGAYVARLVTPSR